MKAKLLTIQIIIAYFLLFLSSNNECLSSKPYINYFNIDTSASPRISAEIILLDSNDKQVTGLKKDDFKLIENNLDLTNTLTVDCIDSIVIPSASIILILDQSSSMKDINDSGQTRWSWVVEAATAFIKKLDLTAGTKVALITFGNVSYIKHHFTDDKTSLIDTLNKILVSGGTLYEPPFLDHQTGAVNYFKTFSPDINKRRIIVFLTDGEPYTYPNVDSILTNKFDNGLLQNNVQVYSVTVGMKMHSALTRISSSTGGKSFEVFTKSQLIETYENLAYYIQNLGIFCKINWLSPYSCENEDRIRELKITYLPWNDSVSKSYIASDKMIVKYEIKPEEIYFGDADPMTSVDKFLTFKSLNNDMTINDIQISPSGFFDIIDYDTSSALVPPFILESGKEITMKIRFTQGNSKLKREAKLNVNSTLCPFEVNLFGGTPSIRIVKPNGGETFSVCDSITIKWTGIEPDVPVNLFYSSDKGRTWDLIANGVEGLSHIWQTYDIGTNYLIKGIDSSLATDISDSVFTIDIAKLTPLSSTIIIDSYIGKNKDTLLTSFLTNISIIPYTIKSVNLVGPDVSNFVILSTIKDKIVNPGENLPIEILFSPISLGKKTAQLIIEGECGLTLQINLFGNAIMSVPYDNNGSFKDGLFSISPNPAGEYIEINGLVANPRFKSWVDGVVNNNIGIFNVLGECVLSVETQHAVSLQRIDVSGLPPGIYFVKIGEWTWKFVKI